MTLKYASTGSISGGRAAAKAKAGIARYCRAQAAGDASPNTRSCNLGMFEANQAEHPAKQKLSAGTAGPIAGSLHGHRVGRRVLEEQTGKLQAPRLDCRQAFPKP